MTKKKKIVLAAVSAAVLAIAALTVLIFAGLQGYTARNTWATIRVTGTRISDTADAFDSEQECLRGDTVSFAGVVLRVTDIRHDGTVSFSVEQGGLYGKDGLPVNTDRLVKDESSDYRLADGSVVLTVTDNRYR